MVIDNKNIDPFDEFTFEGIFQDEHLMSGIRQSSYPFVNGKVEVGIPFNLEDFIVKFGKENIPNCLGIYHLFYNENLIYIGMSKKIRERLICHLRDDDMPFNNVLWFCADQYKKGTTVKEILHIEYRMIKKFKPVLNMVHNTCR